MPVHPVHGLSTLSAVSIVTVATLALLLAACGSSDDHPTLEAVWADAPPFYLEGEVITPRDVPRGLDWARADQHSLVRYWFHGVDDWTVEITTRAPAWDVGVRRVWRDEDRVYTLDARRGVLDRAAATDANGLPFRVVGLLGPAFATNMDEFLAAFPDATRKPVRETVAGVETVVVELELGGLANAEGETVATANGQLWIDPERMFVLRWDTPGVGAGKATRLRFGDLPDDPPAADRSRVAERETCGSWRRDDSVTGPTGIQVPVGFARPTLLPTGWEWVLHDVEHDDCDEPVVVVLGARPRSEEADHWLLVAESRRSELPDPLRTSQELLDASGLWGYLDEGPPARFATWWHGVAAVLQAEGLSIAELLDIAAALQIEPPPEPPALEERQESELDAVGATALATQRCPGADGDFAIAGIAGRSIPHGLVPGSTLPTALARTLRETYPGASLTAFTTRIYREFTVTLAALDGLAVRGRPYDTAAVQFACVADEGESTGEQRWVVVSRALVSECAR